MAFAFFLIATFSNSYAKSEPDSKENPDEGYRSRFSHQEEWASPGYFAVKLKDYGIKVELTVSEHAGFHKNTFSKSDAFHILIDTGPEPNKNWGSAPDTAPPSLKTE